MLIVLKSGSHNLLKPLGPVRAFTGITLSLLTFCDMICTFSVKQSKPTFKGVLQLTYSEMSATRRVFIQQVSTTAEYFLYKK
jgi:hypothetical protein